MFKLLSRKILGEKYRSVITSVIIAAIIGGSLSTMEVTIPIAQSILIMFSLFYTGPIVLQALASKDNARCLKGLFAMPCNETRTLWEYAAVIGIYALFTKTILLFALIYAFTTLTAMDIVIMVLASFFSIVGTMIIFGFRKKAPLISLLIIAAAVAMAFLLPNGKFSAIGFAAADIILLLIFSFLKLEDFRVTESSNVKAGQKRSGGSFFPIPKYIVRYLLSNKSYIISPLFLLAFAVFFAYNANTSGMPAGAGLAMGLISVNSPIAVIVSSNRNLKNKLDMLPGKAQNFFVPYGFVVAVFFMIIYAIYITAVSIILKNVDYKAIILAPIFSVEAGILNAILESRFPITKWKTEPDLFRHPRKYIIPLIIMFEAAIVYFLPA